MTQQSTVYRQALMFPNMNKSGNLMSVLPLFHGMRVKLTKKVLPPALVQEAPGEVLAIIFNEKERFGDE